MKEFDRLRTQEELDYYAHDGRFPDGQVIIATGFFWLFFIAAVIISARVF